ncbi:restriction endonuclease subunit S, partial [Aerococcaceae bacterium zg-1292]
RFSIKDSIFFEMPIPLPHIVEQQKIGEYLTTLDHLITLHQRKEEGLQTLKKTLLAKMFPKNGKNIPELRFKGFSDAWEQRKLGEIVDVRSGKDYKHLSQGNIPVYGTGGYMLSVDSALSYEKDAIGIGRKGTINSPYLLRAPFWTVDTLFYSIPQDSFDLMFIYCIFQKINWYKKDESTGVPSLSKININNSKVFITNTEEQSYIGKCFSHLDHLITLHQRKVEKLKILKKSMLEKMFI